MRAHVLVAVLALFGCATWGDKPVIVGPLPDADAAEIARDMERISRVLASAELAAGMACDLAGSGTDVCLTISHALDVLAYSAQRARSLFDAYQRGGLGADVVAQAIEAFFEGFSRFGEEQGSARRLATDGSIRAVATAYCTRCCGVVVAPKAGKGAGTKPAPSQAPP
jgi:hypothetical protein